MSKNRDEAIVLIIGGERELATSSVKIDARQQNSPRL